MASFKKDNGRYYARSTYYIGTNGQRKKQEIRVPLQSPNENHISLIMAKNRLQRYENKIEAIVIQKHKNGTLPKKTKKGKKVDWSILDWYSKNIGLDNLLLMSESKSLSDAVNDWLSFQKGQRLSEQTIKLYARHLNNFLAVIGKNLKVKNLSTYHIDTFSKSEKGKDSTLHSKLRTIGNFLGFVCKRPEIYELETKPMIEKPKLKKKQARIIHNSQFDNALNRLDRKYPSTKAGFLNSAYNLYRDTGLRLAEPFNGRLMRDCLLLEAGRTKNSYERNVYLNESQVIIIKKMRAYVDQKERDGYNRTHQIKYFSRIFKSVLDCNLIETHFHNLRDTFATRLYYLTGDIYKVCGALGHSDISMTVKYTKYDVRELAKAFPDIAYFLKSGHRKADIDATELLQSIGQNSSLSSVPAGVV